MVAQLRARPQLRDHGPLLAQVQPAEPAMRDAAQQRQHGGLFELLLRAGAQVGEQLDIPPRIGQLLRYMEWSERAAQLGREVGLPALTRQMADFALRAKAGEGGPCPPGGGLRFGAAPGPALDDREVPRRLGQELRTPLLLRPPDDLPQRPVGRRYVALGRAHGSRDPQVL